MKRSEILDIVKEAINQRPPSPCGRWLICYSKAKIRCIPTDSTCKPELVFTVITRFEANRGLSENQWAQLEAKIYTFLRDKGICETQ